MKYTKISIHMSMNRCKKQYTESCIQRSIKKLQIVMCNVMFTDHRRWLKRCLLIRGDHIKKRTKNNKVFKGSITFTKAKVKIFVDKLGLSPRFLYSIKISDTNSTCGFKLNCLYLYIFFGHHFFFSYKNADVHSYFFCITS